MTDDELAELEHLANAATAGPWEYIGGPTMVEFGHFNGEWLPTCDAEFIAAARTAVPSLVAEVRRLRTEVEQLRAEIRAYSVEELSRENDDLRARLALVEPVDG